MSIAKSVANRMRASAAARKATVVAPRATLPKQLAEHQGKMTVVLDIDETLVHSKFSSAKLKNDFKFNMGEEEEAVEKPFKDMFKIEMDGFTIDVNKRPHLDWFLKEASAKYELVTFTAGVEAYGKQVLQRIDPNREFIKHRLFRHNCTKLGPSQYVKDLQHLNRPLAKTVLVDNNPICFLPQPENGIPVVSFYDQEDDDTLPALMNFLDSLQSSDDVRPHLTKMFRLHEKIKFVETKDVEKAKL